MTARARTAVVDRSRLPEPGPARTFDFPAIEKSQLPNGLNVWTVGRPDIPLIARLDRLRAQARESLRRR